MPISKRRLISLWLNHHQLPKTHSQMITLQDLELTRPSLIQWEPLEIKLAVTNQSGHRTTVIMEINRLDPETGPLAMWEEKTLTKIFWEFQVGNESREDKALTVLQDPPTKTIDNRISSQGETTEASLIIVLHLITVETCRLEGKKEAAIQLK